MNSRVDHLESRVILLAPTPNDGAFTSKLLLDLNVSTTVCTSMREVVDEASRGAAMLVLATEAIESRDLLALGKCLRDQPPWSDLPTLFLLSPSADRLAYARYLGNIPSITYLKRPIEVVALVASVQAGVRDRHRQYALREHLVQQENQSRALIDADRRKDEFLATLAHELRNPLSPLRSGIDILLLEDDGNHDRVAVLQMMDRQLQQMVRLVDDLLDVSRITRDKLIVTNELVEVQAVIKASIETVRQLLKDSHIKLKSVTPCEPVYVHGDFTRLTQVVSNLLNNAVKYSEDNSEVEVVIDANCEQVSISVRDTGIGIPPEMLSKIFEMFTQVDSSLTRSRGGLGIGLTLVRRIVEMHGGTISAESRGVGLGSTFSIKLRRVHVDRNSTLIDDRESQAVSPKRILVVDDTRAARVMLSKLLRKLGHEVVEAENARTALAHLETDPLEMVFSDIGMPEMDGYALAKEIRKSNKTSELVLVALTGYGQDSDKAKALNAGFNFHLVKPVSYAMLQSILKLKPIS